MTSVPSMTKKSSSKPSSLNNSQLEARRIRVLRMLDNGKTAQQVANHLALPLASVAAYSAHRTMGRY